MTQPGERLARELVERLRSSAKAFRENPIYTQDGDTVYITVQAEECEEAAAEIERLSRALSTERAAIVEAERVLRYALEAIDTGRSEPLFVARDTIRNYFDDLTPDGGAG